MAQNVVTISAGSLVETANLGVMKAGDTGVGNISMGALTATSGNFSQASDNTLNVTASGTVNAASLVLTSGNGTTSVKYSYIIHQNSQTVNQQWRVGTYGTDNYVIGDYTAGIVPLTITKGTGAVTFYGAVSVGALTATLGAFTPATYSGASNRIIDWSRTGLAVSGTLGYDDVVGVMYVGTVTSHGFAIRSNNTNQLMFTSAGAATFTSSVQSTTHKVTSAAGYISSDGSTGYTGTVTTASLVGKTLTIKDGIITGFA